MIALIDYGSGNLRSVHKALLKVGAEVRIVQKPGEVADARAMVLPGVGAFDDCLNALGRQSLLEGAREFIRSGRPFLGICVGYLGVVRAQRRVQQLRRRAGRFPRKRGTL